MTEAIDRWGFPIRTIRLAAPAKPEPKRQRGKGSFVEEKLLAGLKRLELRAVPGHSMTRNEIADECGVSKDTIRLIEREAIRKVRARLGRAQMGQLAEILQFSNHASLRHVQTA